jgi:RNA polymerase sigma-70 factor (ECF subfamily)
LVDAARRRDDADLDLALQRAWGLVYAKVRARGVYDRDDAEELTQEVFVRVLARIGAADGGGPVVREYLVRAAEHLVIDRQRRLARRGGADELVASPEEPEPSPSAEDVLLDRADADALLEALARLPELQRRVLRLRILDELSAEAVGAIIGKRAAAVRQIQHRAVLQLRRLLDEQP